MATGFFASIEIRYSRFNRLTHKTHKLRTNRTNDSRGLHVLRKRRFHEAPLGSEPRNFFCEDPSSIPVLTTRIFVLDVDRMAFFVG